MRRPRLPLMIGLALSAAVSAGALFTGQDDDVVRPVSRAGETARIAASPAATPPATGEISLRLEKRPDWNGELHDVFAPYSRIAPAAPGAPAPPSAPQAPPLPFTFGGWMEVDGAPVILLIEGERTFRVRPGEQVESFRLEAANAGGLEFVHVPTGLTARMPVGGPPLALAH